jgi:N-acetylglucosaminyl-diphospho-decaprenol L-rhamnosyltransferase
VTAHTAADVAVVVVSYNSADDLRTCIPSVTTQGVGAVVVVDNDSSDDSLAVARALGAAAVASGGNVGYGAAVNVGAATASASALPLLFVLNPDCVLVDGAVDALVARLDAEPTLGVVGPRVEYPDGSIQQSCRTFPSVGTAAAHGFLGLVWKDNPVSRRYTMADFDHRSFRRVDWVSGAAMLLRRDAFDDVGGFDPGYFMYVEDVDLCWRLREAGWATGFDPAGTVRHTQGTSSGSAPYRLLRAHHSSMLRFERRRRGGGGPVMLLVTVGVGLRFCAAVVRAAVTRAFSRVFRSSR